MSEIAAAKPETRAPQMTQLRPERPLTLRETAVAELMMQGLRSKEIAHRLSMSPKTVDVHLVNLYRKLGAHNRAHATAKLLTALPATSCLTVITAIRERLDHVHAAVLNLAERLRSTEAPPDATVIGAELGRNIACAIQTSTAVTGILNGMFDRLRILSADET